jgi:PAS domain S-box-containing protein
MANPSSKPHPGAGTEAHDNGSSTPSVAAHASLAPAAQALATGARRTFFRIAAVMCLAGSPLVLWLPPGLVDARWLVATFVLLGCAAALASRLPMRHQGAALVAFVILDSAALALVSVTHHEGIGDAALALYGVLACIALAGAGRRAGLAAAGVQLVLLAAAHIALWPAAPAAGAGSGALTLIESQQAHVAHLLLHLLNIAAGTVAGSLIARSLSRHMRMAAERERRFRRLLALAADLYWETDPAHRLLTVADPAQERGALVPGALGVEPWLVPGFECDADVLDQLRADLESHEPLRDVPLRYRRGGDARLRHLLASGAPRVDEMGHFAGYWGVARDVTGMHAAEAALRATENRYRDLFALSPAPLVVHRDGIAIDANPAALALYGAASLEELRRTNLYDFFEPGESRERAYARRDAIAKMPPGTVLPVADFRFEVGGRLLSVRATGVRVEVDGAPAVLVIIADDTERLAAEAAVRQSQELLSLLVATTPDLVAVTEVDSGRVTMINPAFERDLGWRADEAMGRTTAELRIWWSLDERAPFVQELRKNSRVLNRLVAMRTRAGARLDMSVSAALFSMAGAAYVVLTARDLTTSERLRLEREAILANASVGIAVTRERRFVLANRQFEEMYGWKPGELLGQPGRAVWTSDEAYAEMGRRHGPALARGEPIEFELTMARRDGRTLLAYMRAHAIDPVRPQDGGTVWIAEDVTARREAERALQEARRAAEAASRAKSTFLANTSHELRTPLNGIVGLASLAINPNLDAALRQSYLEQIVDSARALTAIISDILDLSKIEAGRLEVETTTFDLAELLRTLQQTYAPQAAARGLAMRFELASDLGAGARGDPLRLRQVIGNFLANAIKFTSQGEVVVRARRLRDDDGTARDARASGDHGRGEPVTGDSGRGGSGTGGQGERRHVRIEVQDTGPGIDAATRARLFRPFTQADESMTRRYGGTGLGLSISRELALLMGGAVGVTSEPGRGSRFWLELPLPEAPLATAPGAPAGDDLHGMRVLMAEDNHVNMLIGVAMLEGWGVEVEQAVDGVQAVQAVQRALAAGRLPDAVLMDLQMPRMSGYEATRQLRATAGLGRLPIVALTAAAMVDERERARAAGMDEFLTKPIDPDRLRAALARWRRHVAAAPSGD